MGWSTFGFRTLFAGSDEQIFFRQIKRPKNDVYLWSSGTSLAIANRLCSVGQMLSLITRGAAVTGRRHRTWPLLLCSGKRFLCINSSWRRDPTNKQATLPISYSAHPGIIYWPNLWIFFVMEIIWKYFKRPKCAFPLPIVASSPAPPVLSPGKAPLACPIKEYSSFWRQFLLRFPL